MKQFIFPMVFLCLMAACSQTDTDHDAEGVLLAEMLQSTTGGGFSFMPMAIEDSDDVKNFIPAVYTYKGKPYTGKITSYDEKQRKIFDGALEEGLPSGPWKFYYASGVVQIEGNYTKGIETGIWSNYFAKDKPRLIKEYDAKGYMLMRTEFYNTGRVKNYQNIKCPEYGNVARRAQFTYDIEIEYIDMEKELGQKAPKELMELIKSNGLRVQ